jgi:predicted amidohydrolase YtcJ
LTWNPLGDEQADIDADPLLRGRPIALRRIDGHAIWVSPRVIELMGELPSDVNGGEIIRDSNGKPTGSVVNSVLIHRRIHTKEGIFIDNAMQLVPIPPYSEAQMQEYFAVTMKHALEYGLTSIHDAESSPTSIAFYKRCVFTSSF